MAVSTVSTAVLSNRAYTNLSRIELQIGIEGYGGKGEKCVAEF